MDHLRQQLLNSNGHQPQQPPPPPPPPHHQGQPQQLQAITQQQQSPSTVSASSNNDIGMYLNPNVLNTLSPEARECVLNRNKAYQDLNNLRVLEIKELCKKVNVPVSGSKEYLLSRLKAHYDALLKGVCNANPADNGYVGQQRSVSDLIDFSNNIREASAARNFVPMQLHTAVINGITHQVLSSQPGRPPPSAASYAQPMYPNMMHPQIHQRPSPLQHFQNPMIHNQAQQHSGGQLGTAQYGYDEDEADLNTMINNITNDPNRIVMMGGHAGAAYSQHPMHHQTSYGMQPMQGIPMAHMDPYYLQQHRPFVGFPAHGKPMQMGSVPAGYPGHASTPMYPTQGYMVHQPQQQQQTQQQSQPRPQLASRSPPNQQPQIQIQQQTMEASKNNPLQTAAYLESVPSALFLSVSKYFDNHFKRNPVMCDRPKIITPQDSVIKFTLSAASVEAAKAGKQSLLVRCFGLHRKDHHEVALKEPWPLASVMKINQHTVYDSMSVKSKAPETICLNVTSGAVVGPNFIELSVDMARSTKFFPAYPQACVMLVFWVDNISTEELVNAIMNKPIIGYELSLKRARKIMDDGSNGDGSENKSRPQKQPKSDSSSISNPSLSASSENSLASESIGGVANNSSDGSARTAGDEKSDSTAKKRKRDGSERNGNDEDHGENESDVVPLNNPSVKLIDPVAMRRIEIAVRGNKCNHLQCFDLRTYIELNRVSKGKSRWHCPVCNNSGVFLTSLVMDAWFQNILEKTAKTVKAVEIGQGGVFIPPPETQTKQSSPGAATENGNKNGNENEKEGDSDSEDDNVYTRRLMFSEEPGPTFDAERLLTASSGPVAAGASVQVPIELD